MRAKRGVVFGVCVWACLVARAPSAGAETPEATVPSPLLIAPLAHMIAMPPPARHVIPSHLEIGNRVFDASVTGLRSYVESIRTTEPQVYAQLAPDVAHLEARQQQAWAILITGLIVEVGSTVYAFAGRSACQQPSIYDPNFAAKTAAFESCTDDNFGQTAKFLVIGLAAGAAGFVGAAIVGPGRSDILDALAKNNRLSPEPLRLQIGYDPGGRLAFAGAALTF